MRYHERIGTVGAGDRAYVHTAETHLDPGDGSGTTYDRELSGHGVGVDPQGQVPAGHVASDGGDPDGPRLGVPGNGGGYLPGRPVGGGEGAVGGGPDGHAGEADLDVRGGSGASDDRQRPG